MDWSLAFLREVVARDAPLEQLGDGGMRMLCTRSGNRHALLRSEVMWIAAVAVR